MTVILGFNAFHADSAACLVVDGQLVGAVAEERLGERESGTDHGFHRRDPRLPAAQCLAGAGRAG